MTIYNWYFSQSGNDTYGTGSISNPWKTLSKAKTQINSVNSVDTANLYFKRGDTWSFNTGAAVTTTTFGLRIGNSNPIVNINAYGSGNKPCFDGKVTKFSAAAKHNATTGPLSWTQIFSFERESCNVKNIEIKQVYGNGILTKNADYFTLENCNIHHFGSAGIAGHIDSIIDHITVRNNIFHTGQQLWRYRLRSGWGAAISFITANYQPNNNLVQYNVVYDIYGEGINAPNSIVEYNIVGDTYSIGINTSSHRWDSKHTIVRYNLVTSADWSSSVYSGGPGIRVFDERDGGNNRSAIIEIYGNIIINRNYGIWMFCAAGRNEPYGLIKVYNNTIIDCHTANMRISRTDHLAVEAHVYNNSSIIYDRVGIDPYQCEAASDFSTFTIENNHAWIKGGLVVNDINFRFHNGLNITDPKLSGEPAIDWDGQSGPTYFKNIKFSDIIPLAGSSLIGSGKPLGVGFDNIFLAKGTDFSTLPDNPKFNFTQQPSVGNWDIGAIVTTDFDPCAGVVCPNICVGNDLWSQKCDPSTGLCVSDQLIESNSIQCYQDPCAGVVCDNICVGNDLWSQNCDPSTGLCVPDRLIESNSPTCMIDPCEGVVCTNICLGTDLYSQKCEGGLCVTDQLIESNSVTCGIDPCEGIVCSNICVGNDLWSQKCDPATGLCINDQLLESNSSLCDIELCEGIVCSNTCIDSNLWSRRCIAGMCVPDQLIERNSDLCDISLCEGVVCPNICVDNDLWSQNCDINTGDCVLDQLLQPNSATCMVADYVPSDESTIQTYLILGGIGLAGLAILMLGKNR